MAQIKFTTSDQVSIVGDFVQPEKSGRAVLLIHMMPATRESFEPLATEIHKEGFSTLAIDLRGHGESIMRGKEILDYKSFNNLEHQASRLDVDGALEFLHRKGFLDEKIVIVGASIGANLALDAMMRYPKIARSVLLSPGLDYRGIMVGSAMKRLEGRQSIWLISGENDKYSADSVKTMRELNPEHVELTLYESAKHGTDLFEEEENLIGDIVDFLEN